VSILFELTNRFRRALADLVDDPEPLLDLIRRSQDPRFGDYQANLAMPLGKKLSRRPQDIAAEIVDRLEVDDLCHAPEVAGPGFINLTVRDDWMRERLAHAATDPRLAIPEVDTPMHVGHIRSTVIGNSLARTLRFLGHQVVTDNHLGDWGTQFGMIIYGYKHFLDPEAYRENPVQELARLYRLVRQLVDYHEGRSQLEAVEARVAEQEARLSAEREAAEAGEGKKPDKKTAKALRRLEASVQAARDDLAGLKRKLGAVDADPTLSKLAAVHAGIGSAVLEETAKLHADDEENLRLWHEFMPVCTREIDRMYGRLDVGFDHTLGESYYHDQLESIVDELMRTGVARESDGAICVFLEGHDVPMIIRKKDGAFLYATTDLATLRYRMETFQPDAILYVVDHRQSLHFEQLFVTVRLMGYDVRLEHVSFGTVLGEDGRPFKTRAGDTVGLEGLLDEAVRRAAEIVRANDDAKRDGPELSPDERDRVAEIVGTGAIVYADLSHNRTSDYVFSYDKMLAMNGNTGTYMQYAYARVRSIFAKGNVDVDALRASGAPIHLDTPAERALALELLRFSEALEMTAADYRPNQLTNYLFDLANHFSTFYEKCPVLKAQPEEVRASRLLLCDLTARTIRKGLELLGIKVVDKM